MEASRLGFDDLLLLESHVLERDGFVFLPAFGGEPIEVREVEARGQGRDLVAAQSAVEKELSLALEESQKLRAYALVRYGYFHFDRARTRHQPAV